MNKKDLLESDIKTKFITPAILESGWDEQTQIGTPLELIKAFGSKQKYSEAIIESEKELYKVA